MLKEGDEPVMGIGVDFVCALEVGEVGCGMGRGSDWEGTLEAARGMGWMAAAALERERSAERAEGVVVVVDMLVCIAYQSVRGWKVLDSVGETCLTA